MTAQMAEKQYDIGILLPEIRSWEKTCARYGGLFAQLADLEVDAVLLNSLASYAGDGVFTGSIEVSNAQLGSMHLEPSGFVARPKLVRDLTMPSSYDRQLYADPKAPKLVHTPEVNEFLSSKSNLYELMPDLHPQTLARVQVSEVNEAIAEIRGNKVVVKPDHSDSNEAVLIGDKATVAAEFDETPRTGLSVVQGVIDMSKGLKEYGVKGAHNIRYITVGGRAIIGYTRSNDGKSKLVTRKNAVDGEYVTPQYFSDEFYRVLLDVQAALGTGLEDSEQTVLAVNLARGKDAEGERVVRVMDINRKPLRISPWNTKGNKKIRWASRHWDRAEAKMLAEMVLANQPPSE